MRTEVLSISQGGAPRIANETEVKDQTDYRPILEFWFDELEPGDWFKGGEQVDRAIKNRFEDLLDPVYHGEHDSWLESPEGRLAAILVLDQFPRNLYRTDKRMFAYDNRALRISLEGIARGMDAALEPFQRVFFYLPLEHSEVMEDQDMSIERFSHLVTRVRPGEADTFREYLRYAWRHYEIIRRFGRYPHRNEILGRTSTQKELAFLQQPGSSFL